ncbi:AAA family ATPase [bacterium SCSIO 12741]|nr:AAA family ATPase [bacterium SCSIO 12741]
MKVKRIGVKNYRLLKDFRIELEDELSLVVGKNNTGKTSLLTVIDKFLNRSERNRFTFNDFNIELKNQLKELIENDDIDWGDYSPLGIEMQLLIEYHDSDSLANLSRVMMDLDPDHHFILLSFGYTMSAESLKNLREDYSVFKTKEEERKRSDAEYKVKDSFHFLKNNLDYFKHSKLSLSCSKDDGESDNLSQIDLEKEQVSLRDIINFQFISAKRDVTNREVDKTLSIQTSRIYEKTEATDEHNARIEDFKNKLIDTDVDLSEIYQGLFHDTIEKVRKFGGVIRGESEISVESTLQHRDLLKGNTTVMYTHGEHSFPEYNNGLGYMNLISIIFEIEILLREFKRTKNEAPADINLLFIEEPEAHTHPQMQYIFIKNIKELLGEGIVRDDESWRLQYIISTHSSHIVSESDFDDIHYLKRIGESKVIAKSLKSLQNEYEVDGEEKNYRFLKQYLTLSKAELFFADKAILVEGDTERIILPAMMKKIDQERDENPLLSQNISLVEVGAHSQVFEKFIEFVGIKTLIITDIDSAKIVTESEQTKRKACRVTDPDASISTNASLNFFLGTNSLTELIGKTLHHKRLSKQTQTDGTKKWVPDENGRIQLVFQSNEMNSESQSYHARSFEDSFVHINAGFVKNSDNSFRSLTEKHLRKFRAGEIDVYDFSNDAIGSKPSFAIEILLNSSEDTEGIQFSNWQIPVYIKEGLLWLKDN